MERQRTLIWLAVGIAAVLIVWKVGFDLPASPNAGGEPKQASEQDETVADPNQPANANEAEDAGEPNAPVDANEFLINPNGEPNEPEDADDPNDGAVDADDSADPNDPNEPADVNEPPEPMELLNLRNVEMKNIIEKLSAWTGKVIIPTDESMGQKVTIYASERLPRNKALEHIYGALRLKGIVAEHTDDAIYLKPIADAKLGQVPTIPPTQPLATIENKDQVVQKFFQLKSFSPSEMAQIVQPLIGEHGFVSADEMARTLLVIDTVKSLMRIEMIIAQFDVPEAEQTVTEIFNVGVGDPLEMVQMLKILVGESEGYSSRYDRRDRNRQSSSSNSRSSSSSGSGSSVVVGTSRGPIVLIPEPRRKWIIARASAEDMKLIRNWIEKLDRQEPVAGEYEVVKLKYADPREIEDAIEDGFRDMPGIDFLPSIMVEPLSGSGSVLLFGNKDLRDVAKKMIQEVDVPPGNLLTERVKLQYADPDTIKEKIEEMYSDIIDSSSSSRSRGYSPWDRFRGGGGGGGSQSDVLKVIAYVSLKEVTVITSPERMPEILDQINKWDSPLNVEDVKPRIIELHNSDPVQMAELLNSLFSSEGATRSGGSSSRNPFLMGLFGTTGNTERIVGALYGQLTFREVPGTKKIIVISKIPEAYDVIEELVRELDRQEMAEIPTVITLKYADPEDLSQRLNAMFNEAGTTASVQLQARGLSDYSMEDSTSSTATNQNTNTAEWRPWWSQSGARSRIDEEMPISNVIGKIRFVPEARTKSIMVLCPPEFLPEIKTLIDQLDVPGKQVMVKAVIIEVDHERMTSLGLQVASNAGAFGSLNENSATIANQLELLTTRGSLTFSAMAEVTAMLDFLTKHTNAKILNQQTLWTKDNEEATFFKGNKIAFQTDTSVSGNTGLATTSFEFERVGMTLRVRPSITPENNVDMIINVIISQLTSDLINQQPVRTEMDTTTNMIIEDGQTLMLGGILFQQDSHIERKIPLLGDLPGAGELFKHHEIQESNNEMLVLITPYVIDDPNGTLPETQLQIEKPQQRFKGYKDELDETMEKVDRSVKALKK